jgi:formamidopyrimidine-DNA glycosylase
MPEGAEVWILSKAINLFISLNKNKNIEIYFANYYGKHLLLYYNDNTIADWTFGLTGKVYIDENYKLNKIYNSQLAGGFNFLENSEYYKNQSSICWMSNNMNNETLQKIINKWKTSRKKLGDLLLDQTYISGIGVAWGSEILYNANLRPDLKACEQNLDNLCNEILNIKYEIKNIYNEYLKNNENDIVNFINNWYNNLYNIRQMNVYKKGKQINMTGRKWWVKE